MLIAITDQTTIDELYLEFNQTLIELFPIHRPELVIGHRGGATGAEAYGTDEGDFWTCASTVDWNPFGIGANPSMVVQVNFSTGSTTRKSIGVFAEDDNGQIVVMHRGNIGGGRKGIGKKLLMSNTHSPCEWVQAENQEIEMLVVGQLRSPLFGAQLKHFVAEVQRVKQLPEQASLTGLVPSLFQIEEGVFKSEASGYSTLSLGERRASNRTHGLVVDALKKQLQQRFRTPDWHIYNDRHRDLIFKHREVIVALFEIKTVANTQDVATALGQLLLYGAAVPAPLRRIMVLPEPLTSTAVHYLAQWGIECIYFSGRADKPIFANLSVLLDSLTYGQ